MYKNRSIGRRARRVAVIASVAAFGTTVLTPAAHAETADCVPYVYGYGPTITVDVDYQDPARSSAYYDSSDFSVKADLCI